MGGMGKQYHNEAWLREQYVVEGRSTTDIAEECDVTATTISDWLHRHDIGTRSQREAQQPDGQYTNRKWLHKQYVKEERSMADIASTCDVTPAVILKWLRRFGIKTRQATAHSTQKPLGITNEKGEFGDFPGGYRKVMNSWMSDGEREYQSIYIHQLLAISEGADPKQVFSDGKYHVHHKNGIRWDNRPDNLEFTTREEHMRHHNTNRERTETGEWL